MLRVEQEELYFKVFDDNGYVLAYFQPDYGNIEPKDKEVEIIKDMIKNKEEIYKGLLYLPMLKMHLNEDMYDIDTLKALLELALAKIDGWKSIIEQLDEISNVRIVKSHTDPDMLALLLDVKFRDPIRLDNDDINNALLPILKKFIDNRLL